MNKRTKLWVDPFTVMKTRKRRAKSRCRIKCAFGIRGWSIRLGVASWLFIGSVAASFAGYTVKTEVDSAAGMTCYTWTVYNEDQSWGLDVFAIEVPVETRVLAHTVPPPYSHPDRAYWTMKESREAQVDPHTGEAYLAASRPGKKWLIWGGAQSPSVYPPGTTATFSVTTDDSVKPGAVPGSGTTYTPQNNPHYYFSFQGKLIGPSSIMADAASLKSTTAILQTPGTEFYSVLSTNLDVASEHDSQPLRPASLSIGLYAGVTIDGAVGQTYGIQYSTDLTAWHGLVNVTLSAAKQIWIDSQPLCGPQRYYRVVQGPISIDGPR